MALAAEMIGSHSTLDSDEILANMLHQPGYATPKIDVRGAAIRDGKILFVREASDGRWCLPGGWADVGDAPAEAVVREMREESGFDVRVSKLIGVFDANRDGRPVELYHAFKIVFLCEITGGEATPSHETPEVDFFPLIDPPPLSRNRTHPRHLTEIQKHFDDPARRTYFE
jgi:ADP-ribose pyrophosphatase YjhB (NUDIX family)